MFDVNHRRFKDELHGELARIGAAHEAVEILKRRGFTARRLLLGAPDWALVGEALEPTG